MNKAESSLKSLQEMLHGIYDEHDRSLYSDPELLLRVNEEVSEIDELVRKEKISEITQKLPHLFVWLMAFIDRAGIDIAEALWDKYPGVCPYCLRAYDCMCISQDQEYDPGKSTLEIIRKDRKNIPQSLSDWQTMFKRIYGRVNGIQMLIQVWLHVSEEIGEISGAFRKKQNDNLREETADGMAWILSTATKLNVNLQDLVLSYYPGKCWTCGKEKCECLLY